MRFLFYTFFLPDALGVRSLAAYMHSLRHDVHIVQLKSWGRARVTPHSTCADALWMQYDRGTLRSVYPEAFAIAPDEYAAGAAIAKDYQPDVVCLSVRTHLLAHVAPPLLSLLKKECPGAFIVCGGMGPTLQPDVYLARGADAVIRGEGEHALKDLADILAVQKNWRRIPNVAFLSNNEVRMNPLRPPEKNLDIFPAPFLRKSAYSFIDSHEANTVVRRLDGAYTTMTSRGCMYACSYCGTTTVNGLYPDNVGKKVRHRSVDNILDELLSAKHYGYKEINIADDVFYRPDDEMLSFLHQYKKKIDLPYYAFFHPQQLLDNREILETACDAGLIAFACGIQCADEEFCKTVYNRNILCADYPALFFQFTARGIDVGVHFIGGNPLETEAVFQKNCDFMARFSVDASRKSRIFPFSFFLTFFPHSPLERNFPEIAKHPRDLSFFLRRAILLELRQLLDDQAFARLRAKAAFDSPEALLELRDTLMFVRQRTHLFQESARIAGKKVYFWGCGTQYHTYKKFFWDTAPQAMLLDQEYGEISEVDGIKVCRPEDILPYNEPIPIVIFANEPGEIFRKIRRLYTNYTDVISF